jgi:hypothetical protein
MGYESMNALFHASLIKISTKVMYLIGMLEFKPPVI